MFKKSKSAFTLAEVLITLGIIGVVAAMTMPTLLNSTQGAQYRAAVKKELSVLSQAIVLNIALDDYDIGQTSSQTAPGGNRANMYNLFKNRMNVVATGGEGWTSNNQDHGSGTVAFGTSAGSNYTFFFNDGTTFTFRQGSYGCSMAPDNAATGTVHFRGSNLCKGALDINGSKNPNRVVSCTNASATDANCQVQTPTDIYPVVFYDQTILPNSPAARAVLFKGKQ